MNLTNTKYDIITKRIDMVMGIDLGSNSLRICTFDGNKKIKSAERIVGSARELMPSKMLQESAKQRIKKALYELRGEFDFSLPKFAVATEAFRIALNSSEFFKEIEEEFNIKFKVIDSAMEANLTQNGIKFALKNIGVCLKDFVFIDMGGASTEIGSNTNKKSFAFGIVSFAEKCQSSKNMRLLADNEIKEARKFLINLNPDNLILTSGVPTSVAALKAHQTYSTYKADIINGSKIYLRDFNDTFNQIINLNLAKAEVLLGPSRKDLVMAGCALFYRLLAGFKEPFLVIDDGLREGAALACYEAIQNTNKNI